MVNKVEPLNGLNYGWPKGEDNWNLGMDENLVKLGVTVDFYADNVANAPLGSEANGATYLVGTSPTDLFTGKANNYAAKVEGAWVFCGPSQRQDHDAREFYQKI